MAYIQPQRRLLEVLPELYQLHLSALSKPTRVNVRVIDNHVVISISRDGFTVDRRYQDDFPDNMKGDKLRLFLNTQVEQHCRALTSYIIDELSSSVIKRL